MTSDELIIWMNNNIDVDYEDMSSRSDMQTRLIAEAEGKGNAANWESFKASMKGTFGDNQLEPIIDIKKDIEAAEEKADLPTEDVSSVSKIYRKPLEKGMEEKLGGIQEHVFETISRIVPRSKPEQAQKKIRLARAADNISSEHAATLSTQVAEQIKKVDTYTDLRDKIFEAETPEEADRLVKEGEALGLSKVHIDSLERAREQVIS